MAIYTHERYTRHIAYGIVTRGKLEMENARLRAENKALKEENDRLKSEKRREMELLEGRPLIITIFFIHSM